MSFLSANQGRSVEMTLLPGRSMTHFPAKEKWELKNTITAMQTMTQCHEQSDAPYL